MSQQPDCTSGALSQRRSAPPEVWTEAQRIKEMMLSTHYFPEASWLVAAIEYPQLCGSPAAQNALRDTAKIAWQWGAPNLALWLNAEVLQEACRVDLAWSDEFPAMQDMIPSFRSGS